LKNETKKLLEVIGNVKKSAANSSNKHTTEIAKLGEEIAAMRDSRNVLEKRLRNCSCLSGAVVANHGAGARGTKASEQTKVDQITATARAEIQKLVSHEMGNNEVGNLEQYHEKVLCWLGWICE
jgi:hypothetical protein